MNIQIRKCGIEDLKILQSLGRETYFDTFKDFTAPVYMDAYLDEAFSTSKLKSEIEDPASDFFLLFKDDEIAGYMKTNEGDAQTEIKEEDSFEIQRIYVKREFQGLGLGRFLLEKAIEIAKEKRKSMVWVQVWTKNENGIGFYERFGFEKCGEADFYMGDEKQEDILMKLDLDELFLHRGKF